jgi:hypothetical protein
MPKTCHCDESYYEDEKEKLHDIEVKPPLGFVHDCQYVAARNKLIAEASAEADDAVPTMSKAQEDNMTTERRELRNSMWNMAFADAMSRLVLKHLRIDDTLMGTVGAANEANLSVSSFVRLAAITPAVTPICIGNRSTLVWTRAQAKEIASRRKKQ